MSFTDEIKSLATDVPGKIPYCKTEEATKAYLIQPFIRALGYDVNDPMEVIPEFTADVDPRRVDRVDYAIMKDGKPIMLFECKVANSKLDRDERWSQLFTYFIATDAKFGILTNGVLYQFFSDLDQRNRMDRKPFLEFNLLEQIDDSLLQDVEKFTKEDFDPHINWNTARELKYTREIKRVLSLQLDNPSDRFMKFLTSQMDLDRNITKAFMQRFAPLTRKAFNQFIIDEARKRLEYPPVNGDSHSAHEHLEEEMSDEVGGISPVSTTEGELQGFYMVKAILCDTVDPKRIVMRDRKPYCGILLDNNNRKPICRLRFNSSRKKDLGLFSVGNREERVALDSLDDIYKYADRLKARVRSFITPSMAA